jgi:hypothetical protein
MPSARSAFPRLKLAAWFQHSADGRPGGIDFAVVERGWYWMDRAQLAYWDGLILASAERLGCPVLLSEDFQSGRRYEGVTVINPFERSPEELTA